MNRTSTLNLLKIHPQDNVLVALCDLKKGDSVQHNGTHFDLITNLAAKHKFATEDLAIGDRIIMYGFLVGKAVKQIRKGEAITTENICHDVAEFHEKTFDFNWAPPDVSKWSTRTFFGYRRSDGQVGTGN